MPLPSERALRVPSDALNISTVRHADEPPDVTCMRCVPAAWCVPTSVTPTKVWDDTGAGGGKPGSIWTVNSLDMVAVVAGHEAPKEIFYDLKNNRFFVDQYAQTENGVVSFT
jgi:hypothetical protein